MWVYIFKMLSYVQCISNLIDTRKENRYGSPFINSICLTCSFVALTLKKTLQAGISFVRNKT